MREKLGTPNSHAGSNEVASPRASSMRAASPARSDHPARRVQHLGRDVDAEELHLRPGAGGGDQVARRAAADLEHPAAGGRRETLDQRSRPSR